MRLIAQASAKPGSADGLGDADVIAVVVGVAGEGVLASRTSLSGVFHWVLGSRCSRCWVVRPAGVRVGR